MAKKKPDSAKEGCIFNVTSVLWILLILLVMAVCWVIDLFLPLRWVVLLSMVGGVGSVALFVVGFRAMKSKAFLWCMPFLIGIGMMSFIGFSDMGFSYAYYQESLIPFWEVSLTLGVAIGIFVTVKWVWKESGIGWRIGSFALVTLLSAILVMVTVCHLNFLLDFQPPTEIHAVIEEKDITSHRKGPDSYEFEMTVDGEFVALEVDWLEYQRYEVGDTYTFKEYKGAFGKPFYLAEE